MGRKTGAEPGALLHSSIALLQERFRVLQRTREMRVKREMMSFFSEAKYTTSAAPVPPPPPPLRCFFHHELPYPAMAGARAEGGGGSEFRHVEKLLNISLWFDERVATKSCAEAEIDTSLHL